MLDWNPEPRLGFKNQYPTAEPFFAWCIQTTEYGENLSVSIESLALRCVVLLLLFPVIWENYPSSLSYSDGEISFQQPSPPPPPLHFLNWRHPLVYSTYISKYRKFTSFTCLYTSWYPLLQHTSYSQPSTGYPFQAGVIQHFL